MISPLKRSASVSERAVLPLPVGPRRITADGTVLSTKGLLDAIVMDATSRAGRSTSGWCGRARKPESPARSAPGRSLHCDERRASAPPAGGIHDDCIEQPFG